MTVDEFMALPAPTKASFVLNEGTELMDRIYIYYIIKLYAFSGMYVELWYKPASNKIDKVLVVELEDVLHLYEKNIDISDLFNNK